MKKFKFSVTLSDRSEHEVEVEAFTHWEAVLVLQKKFPPGQLIAWQVVKE